MSGIFNLPFFAYLNPANKESDDIIKDELHLNLITPLHYIMNLENEFEEHDVSNKPFTKNQQIQVYLHLLSRKKFQHLSGNSMFAIYSDFLFKQYKFNINEIEITYFSMLLDNNKNKNLSQSKVLKSIISRAVRSCVDQSIAQVNLTIKNTELFIDNIIKLIRTENFDLRLITRASFINTQLKKININEETLNTYDIALKFTNKFKELLKANKIFIKTISIDKWNYELNFVDTECFFSFEILKSDVIKLTEFTILSEIFKISNFSTEQAYANIKEAKSDLNRNFEAFCKETTDHNSREKGYWLNILEKENIASDSSVKIYNYLNKITNEENKIQNKEKSCIYNWINCLSISTYTPSNCEESSENTLAQNLSSNSVSI